jgi:hypothetical protein
MYDLIGKPYRLGADGTDPDGALDCIHLVYEALRRLGIPTPAFRADWYTLSTHTVLRDLFRWGERIERYRYDGDVVLIPQDRWAFGVVWDQGILHFHPLTQQVAWCPLASVSKSAHYFRTKENLSRCSAAAKPSTKPL